MLLGNLLQLLLTLGPLEGKERFLYRFIKLRKCFLLILAALGRFCVMCELAYRVIFIMRELTDIRRLLGLVENESTAVALHL